MGEAADVIITYSMMPTSESIKKTADRVADSINKATGQGKSSPGKSQSDTDKKVDPLARSIDKLLGGSFKKMKERLDAMGDIFKRIASGNSFPDYVKSPYGGSPSPKLPEGMASPVGGIDTIMAGANPETLATAALAATEGGGMMGMIGGAAGGLAALGPMLLVAIGVLGAIAAATAITAAFFEAVGPIMKVLFKTLVAVILILLMPFLRILLPYLPLFISSIINMASSISKVFTTGITLVAKTLQLIGKGIMTLVGWFLNPLDVAGNTKNFNETVAMGEAFFGEGKDSLIGLLNTMNDEALNIVANVFDTTASSITMLTGGLLDLSKVTYAGTQTNIATSLGLVDKFTQTAIDKVAQIGVAAGKQYTDPITGEAKSGDRPTSSGGSGGSISPITTKAPTTTSSGTNPFVSTSTPTSTQAINSVFNALGNITATLGLVAKSSTVGPTSYSAPSSLPNMSTAKKVGDAIMRPDGSMVQTDAADYLIATKNPGALGSSGRGTTVINLNSTYNIDGNIDRNELKKIFADISRNQARELRTRTSYNGGFLA